MEDFSPQADYKHEKMTRGSGWLEPYLARKRARQANALIQDHLRSGRILDIGCGSYPYFLSHTSFQEKFAIDQLAPRPTDSPIQWYTINLNENPVLPFEDNYFSIVTLLAVVEHLNPASLTSLFREIYRALMPGGQVIITTPAAWSCRRSRPARARQLDGKQRETEALLIGHCVEGAFTDRERSELRERMVSILELTRDKGQDEIVIMRHELPCIFLINGMCSVYEVRPAICRACSSTSAEHCANVFESRDTRARLRCYAQIREIFQTAHAGLIENCEDMGCQSDFLLIAEAMRDYFQHPRPIEAWLDGDKVFHPREG